MSTLNDIKKLRKMYPNDQEFGSAVSKYLDVNKTCCDNPKNHVEKYVEDSGPYGYYGLEKKCKICGKIIDFKFD